jgi:hypothetical protein
MQRSGGECVRAALSLAVSHVVSFNIYPISSEGVMSIKNDVACLIVLGGFAVTPVSTGCGAAPGSSESESNSGEAPETRGEKSESVEDSGQELLSCSEYNNTFTPKTCTGWYTEVAGCRYCQSMAGICGDIDDFPEDRLGTMALWKRHCTDDRDPSYSWFEYRYFHVTCGCVL